LAGVARDRDPERMLAEALRAQAGQAGPPATPGFGLLSGNDLGLASRIQTLAEEQVPADEPPRRVNGWLIVLVAIALGLACGAVAGLLTVL
jgi:ribose/xylose/arabinose/galactoside ABC-type transport system permease subunit